MAVNNGEVKSMPQYIKLMADYNCWPLWWAGDHDPDNIDPATLPLWPETVAHLERWAETFDSHLNPDDPSSSGFSDVTEAEAFEQEGIKLWKQLREELSPSYTIVYHSLKRRRIFTHPDDLNEY